MKLKFFTEIDCERRVVFVATILREGKDEHFSRQYGFWRPYYFILYGLPLSAFTGTSFKEVTTIEPFTTIQTGSPVAATPGMWFVGTPGYANW